VQVERGNAYVPTPEPGPRQEGETASGRIAVITLGTLISASFSRWKAAPKVRLAGRVGSRPIDEVIDRASLNN
jgi:hypothetical protein